MESDTPLPCSWVTVSELNPNYTISEDESLKVLNLLGSHLLIGYGTAYQALIEGAGLVKGESVLVDLSDSSSRKRVTNLAGRFGANVFVGIDPASSRVNVANECGIEDHNVVTFDDTVDVSTLNSRKSHHP